MRVVPLGTALLGGAGLGVLAGFTVELVRARPVLTAAPTTPAFVPPPPRCGTPADPDASTPAVAAPRPRVVDLRDPRTTARVPRPAA